MFSQPAVVGIGIAGDLGHQPPALVNLYIGVWQDPCQLPFRRQIGVGIGLGLLKDFLQLFQGFELRLGGFPRFADFSRRFGMFFRGIKSVASERGPGGSTKEDGRGQCRTNRICGNGGGECQHPGSAYGHCPAHSLHGGAEPNRCRHKRAHGHDRFPGHTDQGQLGNSTQLCHLAEDQRPGAEGGKTGAQMRHGCRHIGKDTDQPSNRGEDGADGRQEGGAEINTRLAYRVFQQL